MKIFLLFLLITLQYSGLFAQNNKDKEVVNYTLDLANMDVNYLRFMLPSLDGNFLAGSGSLGSNIACDAKFGKAYALLRYQYNWAYGFETSNKITGNSINGYQTPHDLYLNAGYVFATKEVDTKVKFYLKSTGNVAYFALANLPVTRYYMINVGFQQGFRTMSCENKDIVFEGVDAPIGTPAPSELWTVRTVLHYSYLSFGVSTGINGYWKADLSGYGKKTENKNKRVYANLLYMINSSIDPVDVENSSSLDGDYRYNLDSSPRAKMGFMLGYETSHFNKLGFTFNIEGGFLPGIKAVKFGSNFALLIKLQATLAKVFLKG